MSLGYDEARALTPIITGLVTNHYPDLQRYGWEAGYEDLPDVEGLVEREDQAYNVLIKVDRSFQDVDLDVVKGAFADQLSSVQLAHQENGLVHLFWQQMERFEYWEGFRACMQDDETLARDLGNELLAYEQFLEGKGFTFEPRHGYGPKILETMLQ